MTSDGYTPLRIYTPIFTEVLQLDGFIIYLIPIKVGFGVTRRKSSCSNSPIIFKVAFALCVMPHESGFQKSLQNSQIYGGNFGSPLHVCPDQHDGRLGQNFGKTGRQKFGITGNIL